jgi:hypothetical protein
MKTKQFFHYAIILAFACGVAGLTILLKTNTEIFWPRFLLFIIIPSLGNLLIMFLFTDFKMGLHQKNKLLNFSLSIKILLILLSIVLLFSQFLYLTASYIAITERSDHMEGYLFAYFSIVALISNIYFLHALTKPLGNSNCNG